MSTNTIATIRKREGNIVEAHMRQAVKHLGVSGVAQILASIAYEEAEKLFASYREAGQYQDFIAFVSAVHGHVSIANANEHLTLPDHDKIAAEVISEIETNYAQNNPTKENHE